MKKRRAGSAKKRGGAQRKQKRGAPTVRWSAFTGQRTSPTAMKKREAEAIKRVTQATTETMGGLTLQRDQALGRTELAARTLLPREEREKLRAKYAKQIAEGHFPRRRKCVGCGKSFKVRRLKHTFHAESCRWADWSDLHPRVQVTARGGARKWVPASVKGGLRRGEPAGASAREVR